MTAKDGDGSRDFLAFFIIDQKRVLPIPKDLGSLKSRMEKRFEMLQEQLKVSGHFGVDSSQVVSTGNGQVSDLAWISKQVSFVDPSSRYYRGEQEDEVSAIASLLNASIIGDKNSLLGFSDLPNVKFNAGSEYCMHIVKSKHGTENIPLFAAAKKYYYTSTIPVEQGIHAVHVHETIESWIEEGYWTDEDGLGQKISDLQKQQAEDDIL